MLCGTKKQNKKQVGKHTPRQKPSVVDCGCVADREWTQNAGLTDKSKPKIKVLLAGKR